MRHNQNGRRFRGRSNNGQGHHGNNHSNNHGNNHHGRRVNPRMMTFDSNGPDVRIRGNAVQINEKYATLARDAASAGDRVLAESYLQHAEHYQRLINEMTEEDNRHQQSQQPMTGDEPQPDVVVEQSQREDADGNSLDDLDQSFLVGDKRQQGTATASDAESGEAAAEAEEKKPQRRYAREAVETA